MYRDDVCAVCGDSLPPDHLYCREHAAIVDDLLHEVGELVPRLLGDLARLGELLGDLAPETWDYLAEQHPDDPEWPPPLTSRLTVDGADLEVEDADELGMVTVAVRTALADAVAGLHRAMRDADVEAMARLAAQADGAGATH